MCSAQRERIRLEAGAALAADFKQRVDRLKEHQFESLRKTVRKLQETEDVMCVVEAFEALQKFAMVAWPDYILWTKPGTPPKKILYT